MTSSIDHTRITLGLDVVSLSGDELDCLLEALAGRDCRDAAAVAEQIAALRVAGGTIVLMPTEAEADALRRTLEDLAGGPGEEDGGLAALATACAESGSALGIGAP